MQGAVGADSVRKTSLCEHGHPGQRPENGDMLPVGSRGVRCRLKLFPLVVIHVFPIVSHHVWGTGSSYCMGGERLFVPEVTSIPQMEAGSLEAVPMVCLSWPWLKS